MTSPGSGFERFGKTRKAEGGLRARSERGAIGESWWSQRFLATLESFALGGRLTRGKAYARKGQVLSLDIAPGVVSAVVQGSREQPYQLTISLAVVSDWTFVTEAISSQALLSAQLLAGEMPPSLEGVFTKAGVPLFPRSVGDLIMQCSCPDFAVPCKHIAATFYLLAEAFDNDPFQLLLWRGRSRSDLLSHLETPEALVDEPVPNVFEDVKVPQLKDMLDRYWVMPVPLPDRPPTVDTEPDLLLRQLPTPSPALGGPSLVAKLRPLYTTFASDTDS
ncbi:SWIM zinc finger family protein [Catelliglobosispora koreensis]|uniref:SWIM zinc finger family protein n=1 Tax=Catelliglobosispora koreensis TaxID=129052 RepID=UPI0003767D35|nr:SWIM zinc finger family protein [Catelliglobosispora koreensis]